MWFIIFQKYAHYTCSILAPSGKHAKSWSLYDIVSVSLLHIPVQTPNQISQITRKNLHYLLFHPPAEGKVVELYEENDSKWCHFVMAFPVAQRTMEDPRRWGIGSCRTDLFAKPEHAPEIHNGVLIQWLISIFTFCSFSFSFLFKSSILSSPHQEPWAEMLWWNQAGTTRVLREVSKKCNGKVSWPR